MIGRVFPRVYQEWLENNSSGIVSENGTKIYGTQEVEERNETFECANYLPLYVAIGDDSGDTLYLMRRDVKAKAVYASDVGDMNESGLVMVNDDFNKWTEKMNETVEMDDTADCCAIYMVKLPDDIKDIVRIKHCLRLNLSTGALVRALKRELSERKYLTVSIPDRWSSR